MLTTTDTPDTFDASCLHLRDLLANDQADLEQVVRATMAVGGLPEYLFIRTPESAKLRYDNDIPLRFIIRLLGFRRLRHELSSFRILAR